MKKIIYKSATCTEKIMLRMNKMTKNEKKNL